MTNDYDGAAYEAAYDEAVAINKKRLIESTLKIQGDTILFVAKPGETQEDADRFVRRYIEAHPGEQAVAHCGRRPPALSG